MTNTRERYVRYYLSNFFSDFGIMRFFRSRFSEFLDVFLFFFCFFLQDSRALSLALLSRINRAYLIFEESDKRVRRQSESLRGSALHVAVAHLSHLGEGTVRGLLVGQPVQRLVYYSVLHHYVFRRLFEGFRDESRKPDEEREVKI